MTMLSEQPETATGNLHLPVFPDADAFTHSSEGTFKTCPRKYFLRYRLGLVPSQQSDALRIGSAFHLGLELSKNGGTEADIIEAIRGMYADTECPKWLEPVEYETEHQTAQVMALAWHRRWQNDQICTYVAAELPFDLPIINPATGRAAVGVRNRGKIDGIVKLPDGRSAIAEHKTTSDSIEPGSDYWKRLFLDSQLSRYVVAARQLGYAIDTTVYDVTRKPNIRPRNVAAKDRAWATSQGKYFALSLDGMCPEHETPAMYGARLLADMEARPEAYFARNEIVRLDSDIREFEAELWTMRRMIQHCQGNEHQWGAAAWPRNTGACTAMYPCTYLDVCRGMCGEVGERPPEGFKITERLHPELPEREAAEVAK